MNGKRMGQMMLVAAGFAAGAATPAAMVMADAGAQVGVFDEISVKRLNIVEPDGKYRLVLANSERFPGLFMGGKVYKHHKIGRASCRERGCASRVNQVVAGT